MLKRFRKSGLRPLAPSGDLFDWDESLFHALAACQRLLSCFQRQVICVTPTRDECKDVVGFVVKICHDGVSVFRVLLCNCRSGIFLHFCRAHRYAGFALIGLPFLLDSRQVEGEQSRHRDRWSKPNASLADLVLVLVQAWCGEWLALRLFLV